MKDTHRQEAQLASTPGLEPHGSSQVDLHQRARRDLLLGTFSQVHRAQGHVYVRTGRSHGKLAYGSRNGMMMLTEALNPCFLLSPPAPSEQGQNHGKEAGGL